MLGAVAIAGGAGACLAAVGVRMLLRYGGLQLDVPNERSSHTTATPRGGGVAIIFGACAVWVAQIAVDPAFVAPLRSLTALMLVSMVFGGIGLVDDTRGLRASDRLLLELFFALLFVIGGARWRTIELGAFGVELPFVVSVALSVLWLVWVTNLYNFMDGINGIAAGFGVVQSAFFVVLGIGTGNMPVAAASAALSGATVGFLPFNFPKARIFLGDSGSLFLGCLFGGLPLVVHQINPAFGILAASIALGPFLLDATVTLVTRALRRENVFAAHRSHAYQRLALAFGLHAPVTVIYVLAGIVSAAVAYILVMDASSTMGLLGGGLLLLQLVACIGIQHHAKKAK